MVLLCGVQFVQSDGWVGDTSYLTVTVGASAFAWLSLRGRGGAVRVWLAIGVSASALGDVFSQVYIALNDTYPDVSVADGPWIASYVGVGVAMFMLLRRGRKEARSDVDGLIDMVVVVLLSSLVLWEFWLNPTFTDSSVPLLVRGVWGVYPILDATLLALVVRTMIERRARTSMLLLLSAGVSLWLVSDFLFMTLVPEGTLADLLDVGWMLGAATLAAACWCRVERETPTEHLERRDGDVGKARIVLAFAPLLAPACIELVAYSRGVDANPIPLLLATVAFAALAGARALRLLRLRDRAQLDLESSEQLYRALAANSSDAVLLLDAEWVHPQRCTEPRRAGRPSRAADSRASSARLRVRP